MDWVLLLCYDAEDGAGASLPRKHSERPMKRYSIIFPHWWRPVTTLLMSAAVILLVDSLLHGVCWR